MLRMQVRTRTPVVVELGAPVAATATSRCGSLDLRPWSEADLLLNHALMYIYVGQFCQSVRVESLGPTVVPAVRPSFPRSGVRFAGATIHVRDGPSDAGSGEANGKAVFFG